MILYLCDQSEQHSSNQCPMLWYYRHHRSCFGELHDIGLWLRLEFSCCYDFIMISLCNHVSPALRIFYVSVGIQIICFPCFKDDYITKLSSKVKKLFQILWILFMFAANSQQSYQLHDCDLLMSSSKSSRWNDTFSFPTLVWSKLLLPHSYVIPPTAFHLILHPDYTTNCTLNLWVLPIDFPPRNFPPKEILWYQWFYLNL